MPTADEQDGHKIIARNKRARHDYQIIDTWEAGIVLTGTEVKSLRDGKANLTDAYGIFNGGEVYLLNLHISPYEQGNRFNHEPTERASCSSTARKSAISLAPSSARGSRWFRSSCTSSVGWRRWRWRSARERSCTTSATDQKKREAQREMARAVRAR